MNPCQPHHQASYLKRIDRERRIARVPKYVNDGLTNEAISKALGLSSDVVSAVRKAMGMPSRAVGT